MTAPKPKVLIEVGVGKAVEDWLRSAGYDVRAMGATPARDMPGMKMPGH